MGDRRMHPWATAPQHQQAWYDDSKGTQEDGQQEMKARKKWIRECNQMQLVQVRQIGDKTRMDTDNS